MKDLITIILAVGLAVTGYFASTNEVVVQTEPLGAVGSPDVYNDMYFHGSITKKYPIIAVATTTGGATSTILAKDSGSVYSVSASGTTLTLPPVATKGAFYRVMVGGALDTYNLVIDSEEGDNIEGSLIVAGAVVDCDAEDQINFVTDGENIGDYVELLSNGSTWLIVDSGALTSAKLTCTDPT